nr:hypothetical protein [Tanacetum cinerariifolium]
MDTEEPVNEGRLSKETKELVSTVRPEDSTVRPDVKIADPIAPATTTTTRIFDDEDITMAQTLIKMKEEKAKEKGMLIRDIEDSSRPTRSILTQKPLPTINPKDKGKGVLDELEPAKKMTRSYLDAAQIAKDAKVARLVSEEELAELERENKKRQREEEASKAAIAKMFDRMDLEELYNLVMQRFETTSPEGVDLVLYGDLRTMFEERADDDLLKNQEEWILKSWNFYENYRVHTLTLEDGIEIYMLAERRYRLIKESLEGCWL